MSNGLTLAPWPKIVFPDSHDGLPRQMRWPRRWRLLRGRSAMLCLCGMLALSALLSEGARAVDAGDDPRSWLNKIAVAAQSVSYQGTFVYRRDDQLVTMRLIHVAGRDGEREKLVSLSGDRRELLRSKEGVVCIFPGKKHVTFKRGGLDKHFPNQLAGRVKEFEQNYRLTLGGRDRIAGRDARMIVVEPKDNYRYGYRIWIDERSGLLLQSDLVNDHGNAIEQVVFTSIDVMDKPTAEMVQAVTMGEDIRRDLKASRERTVADGEMPWRITRMPRGFALAEHYRHRHGKQSPVEQLVLSDGMATVSVFIERVNDDAAPFTGVTHMGAVNAFGTVMDDHQLTVVGEVPAATVRMIGHSVTLTGAGR